MLPPLLASPRAGEENWTISPPFPAKGGSPKGGQGGARGGYLHLNKHYLKTHFTNLAYPIIQRPSTLIIRGIN